MLVRMTRRNFNRTDSGEPIPGVHETSDIDSGWLLVGKLAPPEQRVEAVRRDALLARLDQGLARPVSLTVSPPGFGKTTLLTQWWRSLAQRADIAACWLTVDELDAEVSRFTAGLILAVARTGVDVGPLEVAARQQSIDAHVRPIISALLEAIRCSPRRVVLILDDYHRAKSRTVDEAVELLIEHGRGELHIAISARQRPTFHVSALWARGLVTMIDAADLAMSDAEASAVLGRNVSPADLAMLHQRTEGWPVALQLARLWMERGRRSPDSLREFSGRTSEMTEYLAEQIVQDLPAELRDFLLETSILERFDASLADAVRERSDSAALLERLAPFDALVVALDEARDWVRLHRLFGDFLLQRLNRGPTERVAALHRRAARALAAIGDLPEAVQHALHASDARLAVELTQAAGGWELILWRGIGYVRSLLKAFDDMTIRAEPTLQLTQAYLDIKLANFDGARELLALTAASLSTANARIRRDHFTVDLLLRIYVDDLSSFSLGRHAEADAEQLDADDHLGRGTLHCGFAVAALGTADIARAESESRCGIQEMRAAGSVLGTNYAFLHLAQSQLLLGRAREAESLFREALVMAEDNFGADSGLKALCSTFLGYCCYLNGDLDASSAILESSSETTDGWVDVFATGYEVRARLAYARGGIQEAIDVVADATRTGRARQLARLRELASAWRVEFLARSGHVEDARREAQAAGVSAAAQARGHPDIQWRVRLASTMAIATLFAASGETARALQLLESARIEYEAAGLILPAWRLEILAIAVLKQRGATDEATGRLQAMLEHVVREGALGLLLEHGPALESLLHAVQHRNRELLLSGAQRNAIAETLSRLRKDTRSDHEAFSARELDVLRELCEGRSNKMIGRLLDLSENTVKFHLKRIFRKLGTESRSAAVAAAVQRGLVQTTRWGSSR